MQCRVKVIGCSKVAVNGFIVCLGKWETFLLRVTVKTGVWEVVTYRDKLGIKRLLHMLKILDRVLEHVLVVKTVLERVFFGQF